MLASTGRGHTYSLLVAWAALVVGCGDGSRTGDAGHADAGPVDAGHVAMDSAFDAPVELDAGTTDTGVADAGVDTGVDASAPRCTVTTNDTTAIARSTPYVAWTGTEALVAYTSDDAHVHGARFSATGAASGEWSYAGLISGDVLGLAWTGAALGALTVGCTAPGHIGCARWFVAFDAAGAVTAGPTIISPEDSQRSVLAWNGARFAAAWVGMSTTGTTFQLTELDATGTPLRADAPVDGFGGLPTITAGPSSWLLAYAAIGASGPELRVTALDASGVAGTTVSTSERYSSFSPVLLDTGTELAVVYDEDSSDDVRHWSVARDLASSSPSSAIAADSCYQGGVSAAWNGSRIGVLWYDVDGFTRAARLRFVETTSDGTPLDAPQMLSAAAHQIYGGYAPPQAVVWTGSAWLVAWTRGETPRLSVSTISCP